MRLLILALCCAICLVACGGDDEERAGGAEATEAPSSGGGGDADWAAQVNAICVEMQKNARELALDAREEGLQGRELAVTVLDRSTPLLEDLMADLRRIEPPGAVGGDYERFLDRIDDAVDLYPRLADTVRGGKADPELNREFLQIAAETRPFANEHGLEECLTDAS